MTHITTKHRKINLVNHSSRCYYCFFVIFLCLFNQHNFPTQAKALPNDSIELLTIKASQGDAQAQCTLGYYHLYGKGVKQDWNTASRLFEKSAQQGYVDAQYYLGLCYLRGIGVPIDNNKAFELFKLATEQNHIYAQHMLAICYKEGYGTPQYAAKAHQLFQGTIPVIQQEAQKKKQELITSKLIVTQHLIGIPHKIKYSELFRMYFNKYNDNTQNDNKEHYELTDEDIAQFSAVAENLKLSAVDIEYIVQHAFNEFHKTKNGKSVIDHIRTQLKDKEQNLTPTKKGSQKK